MLEEIIQSDRLMIYTSFHQLSQLSLQVGSVNMHIIVFSLRKTEWHSAPH